MSERERTPQTLVLQNLSAAEFGDRTNDFSDPQGSQIFQILLKNSKLKDSARNFVAICEGDISAVPSLEDFLVGKNIPVSKPRINIHIPTAPRTAAYISAFPVVDALGFQLAEKHVGDKIELIGQIVEVKADVGRRGRGRDKPYVFINFGPWRGSIVKISIWSEGLAKLKEQPSPSWVGRWVSVTGLLDPPYQSRKFGYTHLSVTVQEDGQIQTLNEAQAQFRLGKRTASSTFVPPTQKQGRTASSAPGSSFPGVAKGTKTTGTSTNKDILKKYGSRPSQAPSWTQPQSSAGVPAGVAQKVAQQSFLQRVPTWAWVALFLLAIYLLFGYLGGPKQTTPYTKNTQLPAPSHPASQLNNNAPRDVIRPPDTSPSSRPDAVPNAFPNTRNH
jgi:hypothetical protein